MLLLSNDKIAGEQHKAVRTTAGWYYFTHHLVEVSGPDAAVLLDKIYTGDIAGLAVGRARYTMMLSREGIIQDDVIIFHIEDALFWISTLHRPRTLAALEANSEGLDVAFKSITEEWDMYAVQGPKAVELTDAVVAVPVDDMKHFSIIDNRVGDIAVKVARSGYSGEKIGFEIYVKRDERQVVEDALAAKQDECGAVHVTEIDVMAYTLATEAGYVLITDLDRSTPFEVGMDKGIDWDKDFIGKDAIEPLKDEAPRHVLLGFTVDDPCARVHGGPKGAPVFKNGELVGRVTKSTFGFTVGKNIGFALVDAGKAKAGDEVILNNATKAVLCDRPILK